MRISVTYMDTETWKTYPRFWFRLVFSLFFGMMNFLYAVEYRMDFLDPAYQNFGLEKLMFFLIGSVLVSECIFHVQNAVEPIVSRNIIVEQTIWYVMAVGTVMSIVLVFVLAQSFVAVYKGALDSEHSGLVALVSVMMVIITSFLYMGFTLYHEVKYPDEIQVEEPAGMQVLKVRDIAHIFCYDNNFLFTYHSGASYEMQLENDLKGFYALLHPSMFFMVNDHAVVSRRACREVFEGEDGSIRIMLEPKPALPDYMIGKIDIEVIV